MKTGARELLSRREKTVPILSFPSTQLLGISVRELVTDAEEQARGMKAVAGRCDIGASLNMMDLSVEAEAFGAEISSGENEIPTVKKGIIGSIDGVDGVTVPQIGAGRTGVYIDGVRRAKEIITDVPVMCGVIGPYSLAGRLMDMTELMMACFDDPDRVKRLLAKCSDFITSYIKAFIQAGADGVILAEPAAGLLSPDMCEEFSSPFVRGIFSEVNSSDFILCYHNCGGGAVDMAGSIASVGADIYHFGNAIRLADIIPLMPEDSIVMGNVDPVLFASGTPEQIRDRTRAVFDECRGFDNFMLSTGCDVPAHAKWENINAYFDTVSTLYK